MTAIARLLPLEGGYNLRDMGGYVGADGRRVRHRTLYRSGMMSMLTEADERHLAELGIATVCDLRRGNERTADPTRWCAPAGVHYWARDYVETSGALGELLTSENFTGEDVRRVMIDVYRDIPVDHAPSYRYMFERLLGGHVPLLFNCSAGKDRTGVAAALILHALGVDREQIFEDYLLSNEHADHARMMVRFGDLARRGPDVVGPLLSVEADYLAEAFAMFDDDHGGIDGYLASIGVDDAAKARLRDLLLD